MAKRKIEAKFRYDYRLQILNKGHWKTVKPEQNCPCSSGKKYKECCQKGMAELVYEDDGRMAYPAIMPIELAKDTAWLYNSGIGTIESNLIIAQLRTIS